MSRAPGRRRLALTMVVLAGVLALASFAALRVGSVEAEGEVAAHILSLRGGYRFGVDEATLPTVGFGVEVPGLGDRTLRADYAFETYERLGPTHRIGIALDF